MDKSWVYYERSSKEFHEGLCLFLNYAFENGFVTEDNKVRCPCKKCANVHYKTRDEIYDDLVSYGMLRSYTRWYHHGEGFRTTFPCNLGAENTNVDQVIMDNNGEEVGDDITRMLRDAYGMDMGDMLDAEMSGMPSDSSAAQFYKLLEDSKKPLYPGCDKMSMMMSDKSFKEMLQLMRESFPEGCTLPENFTQCKKVLSDLGLSYVKIDACPNDCMLYYKETADLESCKVCTASCYKDGRLKTPAKILRHFPLKPRLQRLFMCSKTAGDMRWHHEGRTKDGVLRHPSDSEAWRHFDEMNPTFKADPRNIRLGLSTDGFSPYSSMRNPHSTWLVVLLPYNLPPWLCMKQPNMILSLLIPGPHSPGNDIDVYLRPLIDELKELWEEGVDTYDSSRNEMFNLKAGLLWTISDYPGLAMLSRWSNKGFAPHLRKILMGKVELSPRPNPLLGPDILSLLKDIPHTFGKQFEENLRGDHPRKRKSRGSCRVANNMPSNWKKLSIFYELPYWLNNLLKHNIDVMHTAKLYVIVFWVQ
ncbi:uncharacterized protein LOC113290830 [Papaver somniferum]|uniref:uncharacterized protein LOC113290830 n=1 Tax=Papaver somniferum TaxID=3469 RepID=UPI000E700483|nr:uncharacterized protein LOC113290830 [Papaver somniferum]